MVNTFGGSTASVGVGMQSQVSQAGQMQPNQQATQQNQVSPSRYHNNTFVVILSEKKI